MGDCWSAGRRFIRVKDLQAHAGVEAGPLHARPSETAGGSDEDHGQRCYLLHVAHAFHIHFQARKILFRVINMDCTLSLVFLIILILSFFLQYSWHAPVRM